MRHLFRVSLLAAALALLAAAAPPAMSAPPGVPNDVKLTPVGPPDLFARLRTSPYVARAHVLGPVPGSDVAFKTHVDKWYRGQGPSDLTVDFGQQRPVTPTGSAELIFLGPEPVRDGGAAADLRALTGPVERYEVPDAQIPGLDRAVSDVLANAPEDAVLSTLVQLPRVFSEPAAARLALRANTQPSAVQAADAAARSPQTSADARYMLVSMVGAHLPVNTLAELSQTASDERIRIAALEALGRLAANEPAQRAAAVAAIAPAAKDGNPHLQLAAGTALAYAGQAEAIAPLDAILAGSDQDLRAEAVRSMAELARHGNAEAYDRLEKLKDDKDHEVSKRASNLLGTLGPKPATQRSPGFLFGAISGGVIVVLIIALAAMNRKRRA